jgi:molecular chaperone GrpE
MENYDAKAHLIPKGELEDLRRKADLAEEYLNMLRRVQADFINYQNRVKKEKEELLRFAKGEFILEFLPAIDSIDRSLKIYKDIKGAESFVEGLKIIQNEILRILEKQGVKPIKTDQVEFNPLYHEVVMSIQTEDDKDMLIAEELRKGYMIHDRVLRPAQVKIFKKIKPLEEGGCDGKKD